MVMEAVSLVIMVKANIAGQTLYFFRTSSTE
jgi:hypothetical protein